MYIFVAIADGVFLFQKKIIIVDNYMNDIQRRNREIRKHFYSLLGQGIPIMLAYAMTGQQFYLSEKRIRDIIAKRK